MGEFGYWQGGHPMGGTAWGLACMCGVWGWPVAQGPGHTPEVCPLLWEGASEMTPWSPAWGWGWWSTREHSQCSSSCGDRAHGGWAAGAGHGAIALWTAFLACDFSFLKKFLFPFFFFTNRNTSLFHFYFLFHVTVCFVFFFLTTRAGHAATFALILFKGNTYFRKARHIMW